MASDHNSSEAVKRLAGFYGNDVISVEESYPGIFIDSGPENNFLGEADLLVSDDDTLKAYEVKESGSLNQRTLVTQAREAKKQLDNLETYLETLGYEADTEYLIVPEGHLRSVYEVWRGLPKVFTSEQIKATLSEPGRFPYLEEEALDEKEEGIYEIEDPLRSVLDSGIIQL